MSRSTKFACSLRMKYSAAMLRPPETEKLLSAMNSLLCIRWLMRPNWCSENTRRPRNGPERAGSGL